MGRAPLRHPPTRHPPGRRLLGLAPHHLDPCYSARRRCHSLEPQAPEEPLVLATYVDQRGTRQTHLHRTLLWPRLPLFSLTTSAVVWLVSHRTTDRLDLYRSHYRWPARSAGRSS